MTLLRTTAGELEFRNPKWTPFDTIEVEVRDESYGWIPFNASPDDDLEQGRELFELLSNKYANQVVACPQSEKDAEQSSIVRDQRDILLAQSDWTMLTDVQLENRDDWVAYRQALRDMSSQDGFPHDITWPTKPS